MASVLRRVPGFRTGRRWKQIVAIAAYVVALLLTIGGLWTAGVLAVVIVLLSINPGGFRSRLPLVGSEQRLRSTVGYVLLGAIWVLMFGLNSATLPSKPSSPVAASATPAAPGGQQPVAAATAPTSPPTAVRAVATPTSPPPQPTAAPPTPAPPTPTPAPIDQFPAVKKLLSGMNNDTPCTAEATCVRVLPRHGQGERRLQHAAEPD